MTRLDYSTSTTAVVLAASVRQLLANSVDTYTSEHVYIGHVAMRVKNSMSTIGWHARGLYLAADWQHIRRTQLQRTIKNDDEILAKRSHTKLSTCPESLQLRYQLVSTVQTKVVLNGSTTIITIDTYQITTILIVIVTWGYGLWLCSRW